MPQNTFYSFVDVTEGRVAGPLLRDSEVAEVYRKAYAGKGLTAPCTITINGRPGWDYSDCGGGDPGLTPALEVP